jgi:hypothetical protein
MRALWILLALTGTAAAEAVPPPPSAHRSSPKPTATQLLPILLEDTWHYLNPDQVTSTWEFADVKFTPAGVLLITEHTMSADLVLRGTWRAIDDSHISIERPYAPGRARYTLAACKDPADRSSVCLYGPKL